MLTPGSFVEKVVRKGGSESDGEEQAGPHVFLSGVTPRKPGR